MTTSNTDPGDSAGPELTLEHLLHTIRAVTDPLLPRYYWTSAFLPDAYVTTGRILYLPMYGETVILCHPGQVETLLRLRPELIEMTPEIANRLYLEQPPEARAAELGMLNFEPFMPDLTLSSLQRMFRPGYRLSDYMQREQKRWERQARGAEDADTGATGAAEHGDA